MGIGYIGLPMALLLAQKVKVIGFDIDKSKLDCIHHNKLPFSEKGLNSLFALKRVKNNFSVQDHVPKTDVYIISVPTPANRGKADLTYVMRALDIIRPVFQKNGLIIVESTIGPCDCRDLIIPYVESWHTPYHFVHCPERAIPGNTLYEMIHNDRIIGADTNKSAILASNVYKLFVKGDIFFTDPNTAAMAKVMENTYRAVNIALANELSGIADAVGINVWEAIYLANKHPRVHLHSPGLGTGGHCIPIDPWFLVRGDNQKGIIEKALMVNEQMPKKIALKVKEIISKKKNQGRPTIGILGYAYKKNVDDWRETPSERLLQALEKDYHLLLHDPYVKKAGERDFTNLHDLLLLSSIVIIATPHDEYKKISFSQYANITDVIDCHNCADVSEFLRTKISYHLIGAMT